MPRALAAQMETAKKHPGTQNPKISPWAVKSCVETGSCPARVNRFVFCTCLWLLCDPNSGCNRLTLPEFITPGSHPQGRPPLLRAFVIMAHRPKTLRCKLPQLERPELLGNATSGVPNENHNLLARQIFWRNKPCPRTPTHSLAQEFNV